MGMYSAPKPDPNIGEAARESAALSKEALAWNKQVYEQDAPKREQEFQLAKQFAESAIASQQFNDDLSKQYFDRMKATFFPVEDSIVSEAMASGGVEDQEMFANQARGDLATATAHQNSQNSRMMQSMGINPNSGRYQGMLRGQGVSNAAIEANAMNQARQAAKNLGWAKKADAASLGRNLPGNQATSSQVALQATGAGLNAAHQPIATGFQSQAAMNQGFQTGLQGLNQQGQLGLGIYQGKLQGYQAQNEMIGGMIGLGGSLASSAAGAMKFSDRRLKLNIELIGQTVMGLNLYEFEYLWSPTRHKGVMADEVLEIMPEAVLIGDDGYMVVDYDILGVEFE